MIRTIIHISLMRLWHNKAELVLTFVVPILFFSIFAWIFGSRGNGATPRIKIAICDEVQSEHSRATIELLKQSPSLRLHSPDDSDRRDGKSAPTNRKLAESLVRRGLVSAAVVFAGSTDQSSINPSQRIDVMIDSFDQVAGQVIAALVQKSALSAQAQVLPLNTADFRESMVAERSEPSGEVRESPGTPDGSRRSATNVSGIGIRPDELNRLNVLAMRTPSIAMIDVMGDKKANPAIAMYAAGIAVMFLLFSATTASGSLLEERENSTLERLLCSRMTMDHLLMGKWCYLVLIGILQTTLMFVYGSVFFSLNLVDHLDGFAAMTIVTASAAASFALMLAAICQSRVQLGWVSTVLILSMSALGGSMVPRYLMSENIQRIGQFTFNAWALDGYNKVFWRELPMIELRSELAVLLGCGFVFIAIARLFAARWDRM